MASLTGTRFLFFTTSPRSPMKIIPENDASISHFFTLHNLNIEFYGGKSVIVPLELNVFIKMVEDSYKADYTPTPDNVKSLFEYSKKVSKTAENEKDWFNKVKDKALNWLA